MRGDRCWLISQPLLPFIPASLPPDVLAELLGAFSAYSLACSPGSRIQASAVNAAEPTRKMAISQRCNFGFSLFSNNYENYYFS